ncbi:MFS transporter [Nakamurella flavida]|uniref:MFS transporter n=1 Tax=Nakamurella flavida TaxID=363630 RepID=A0A938YEH0_9ACTN|nr:MFS transporter [Nakamurella flavida]MBM9476181.1 MFS transporter [Nakamurella flavida]MDP9777074.1 EmrB/QacA subfamily drug resistance transporter [Nakamurella flavida]
MSDRALGDPPAATESQPLDPRRWIALVVIGISQLMVVLDATITNVAMPTAAADLGLQQSDIQWVITSYALPFGALLLLGGRIADYVGRKKVLILALSGFALASIIGGIASEAWMLYAGRALQGVFAAMLAPAALSLLTVTFTLPKERAKAFAVFGAIAGGGAAIGLLLGGFLTEYLSTDAISGWRWCFLVNIPIAVIAAIMGARILKESRTTERGHYDLPGALLATAGLAALVWGFTRPIQTNPDGTQLGWGSMQTIGWLVAAVVLLAAFVLVERRSTNPLLPMRIVTNRNRAGAYLVGMLVGAGMFSVFLFLTLYLQDYKMFSPMETGFAFLPFSAGIVAGAGVGSQLVLRIGARYVIAIGATLGTIGLFLFSTIDVQTSYFGHLFPAMLVMAFGMGFIFMSTTNLALVGISNDDAGVASAVFNTTQQIGGSLGTALLSTVAYSSVSSFIAARATGGAPSEALLAQATVNGYGTAFTWAACLFIAAVVIALVVVNAKKDDVPAPTGAAHMG